LVEHVTENHGVGGSIPPLGTIAAFPPFRTMRRALPNPTIKDVARLARVSTAPVSKSSAERVA
jgi:hypothetical protein